jgi:hypothetical protein
MKTLLVACTICLLAACELAARTVRKPDWGHRQELGRVEPGGLLPAGDLAWLPATAHPVAAATREAWLILNVDRPAKGKAGSYAARLSANCKSGLVMIGELIRFKGSNADGRELGREEMKPARFLAPGDSAGQLARSAICKSTAA